MDDLDREILCELQDDARIANNELAGRVGLSPSACLRRVKALEASGVIAGYTTLLDRTLVELDYEPLVWVTLSEVTRSSMIAFEAAIAEIPNVTEAHRMMGQPDYLLRVVTTDAAAFEALYIDVLASLPHVQTLTSQLAMKTVKRSNQLPLESRPERR